jgi:superfamily II DNA or RNA helicase
MENTKTTLSSQGYSIYKSKITPEELKQIQTDLTITPFVVPGYGSEEDITPYKLFKENPEKIYVPYYYGYSKYGKPQKNKLPTLEKINLEWSPTKPMRPYQREIIDTYMQHASTSGGGIISVGCGRGKCLAKGTLIPLFNGTYKFVEELIIGDKLIGDDGTPRTITNLGSGESEMYTIQPNIFLNTNHENLVPTEYYFYPHYFKPFTVNEDHILTLAKEITQIDGTKINKLFDIHLADFLKLPTENRNTYKTVKIPLDLINPDYVKTQGIEYTNEYEVSRYIPNTHLDNKYYKHGLKIGCSIIWHNDGTIYNSIILSKAIQKYKNNIHHLIDFYLGFMNGLRHDNTGDTYPFKLPITSCNYKLFECVEHLLKLLGIAHCICNQKGDTWELPFKNYKHIIILYNEYITTSYYDFEIISKGLGKYYGFTLDGNGRFILEDRVVTHNTVMALKVANELNVKTLILLHKEFLLNQWVERIKEYLPNARIGYIQGKVLDIHRKDIVLGMIQSLSDPRKDKDYPLGIFDSFGLVIADECHHLAAKQFVRALAKHTFKYTLGLSATPKRGDGLERVFKYFLGDIIYRDSEIQKTAEDISLEHIPNSTVEIYNYYNNDYKYCKEEKNYKNKPNVVTMKSNIANCEKRTKVLLSFLPRLISEGRYILLLSCRREHIFQMERLISDFAIPECTIGLYLGGMKQEALDISATKRIIIATFNMAEEAFDCKSLNTLIYMTPHNNIEQAVGRILREEKQKRKMVPLIIDLFDQFSSFVKWNKIREKYYKSKGYPMKIFDVTDNTNTPITETKFIKEVEANCKIVRHSDGKKITTARKKNNNTNACQHTSNGNSNSKSNINWNGNGNSNSNGNGNYEE